MPVSHRAGPVCMLIALLAWSHRGHADNVALAPVARLGNEPTSPDDSELEQHLARALANVPGVEVIAGAELRRALVHQPRLRGCDGDVACLAELGRVANAARVVYAEAGDLGPMRLVYLALVDVASGRELGSTTLTLTPQDPDAARAAAFRLLSPERYLGRLVLDIAPSGAVVFIDGRRVATTPTEPLALPVGSHAVRITHPERRDFVRFADIEFDRDTTLAATLPSYPVIASDLVQHSVRARAAAPSPWYRRWYVIAGASAAVLLTTALVTAALTAGIEADRQRVIDVPTANLRAPLLRF